MRCRACGSKVGPDDEFCARCGARSAVARPRGERDVPRDRMRSPRQAGRFSDPDDDEERLLWRGSFSWKGLIREGGVAATASGVLIYLWNTSADPAVQQLAWPAVTAIWVGMLLLLLYRKLDVSYRLTNQRLMHETGILYRRTHRIEVIDIDDLSFEQGLVERMIGVGRIRVATSDVSDRDLLLVGIDGPRAVYEKLERARRKERMRYGLHVEAV